MYVTSCRDPADGGELYVRRDSRYYNIQYRRVATEHVGKENICLRLIHVGYFLMSDIYVTVALVEIRLMEANYMVDEIVGTTTFVVANYMVDEIEGTTTFSIEELTKSKWEKKTFVLNSIGYFLMSDIYVTVALVEIRLMEANYMVDEIVGTTTFSIEELAKSKWEKKTFVLNSIGYFLMSDIYVTVALVEIRLMEANYMVDEIVGTTTFSIEELQKNKWEKKTFVFNDVSSRHLLYV